MARRTRLRFHKVPSIGTPDSGDVAFYVNEAGDLVRVDDDGTEAVVGTGAEGEGGTFNGGTITEPLEITVPDGPDTAMSVAIGGIEGFRIDKSLVTDEVTAYVQDVNVDGVVVGSLEICSFDENRTSTARFGDESQGDTDKFTLYDATQTPLFRIDADGSVHIKTGTSIVADL